MATLHNLGFPRVGPRRELKFAQERYWKGEINAEQLHATADAVRDQNWQTQANLDHVPVGDYTLYDHVLDTSFLLGHLPKRFHSGADDLSQLDQFFRVARGRAPQGTPVAAGEMTKWFDTNYHYIVPEFETDTAFSLNSDKLVRDLQAAQAAGVRAKPVILGPLSYLWLGKNKTGNETADGADKLRWLDSLVPVYHELLTQLKTLGAEWVQIDEPILVQDVSEAWRAGFIDTYEQLHNAGPNVLLTSYFGGLGDNLAWVKNLPVAGLHVDAVRGAEDLSAVLEAWPTDRVLSLGVIDGRNVWRTDLDALLATVEPIHASRGDRLWLAPSCSLLHVPVSLEPETELDPELRSWLAFATEKLTELTVLGQALNDGKDSVADALAESRAAVASRRKSPRVKNPAVQQRLAGVTEGDFQRQSPYATRAAAQRNWLDLPAYPTTTIGSFPQTPEIRQARRRLRAGDITDSEYNSIIRGQIQVAIREQESYGIDVLVHGEAERNDMVEYFGEQLDGYAFSRFGWVQSYGSRCVKPPIIFGDVARPQAMTVEWTQYAQSLTDKPLKGMLTGPITMLQWAFVRDDQPRRDTALQIALALRDEVNDLADAGIKIIQVDEPAFREGLPLRQRDWQAYLTWAVQAFRLSTSGVRDETQIHTHMCYSEFNDIMASIADLDADVITIETSRSDMELLDAFTDFAYPNEIGPGVYDIHSPNEPRIERMVELMQRATERVPADRLWVNPDCGLKTRQWHEVAPALRNMVSAAEQLREGLRHRKSA